MGRVIVICKCNYDFISTDSFIFFLGQLIEFYELSSMAEEFRALDLKSGGPRLRFSKIPTTIYLDLFSVVPSSTP